MLVTSLTLSFTTTSSNAIQLPPRALDSLHEQNDIVILASLVGYPSDDSSDGSDGPINEGSPRSTPQRIPETSPASSISYDSSDDPENDIDWDELFRSLGRTATPEPQPNPPAYLAASVTSLPAYSPPSLADLHQYYTLRYGAAVPSPDELIRPDGIGSKHYAVTRGARVGVYSAWVIVSGLVNGMSGPVYKRYPTFGDACDAYRWAYEARMVAIIDRSGDIANRDAS
ncbi:hypothetical protein V5O48_016638 [Marasmius crinis-equi]|uniref:Ribonuclease H1 N-terminal domain-containing protein n=1 Tax=Marasmius crinis-equi TaxID=585013 RepID=A0ABR3ERB7_9AGAR